MFAQERIKRSLHLQYKLVCNALYSAFCRFVLNSLQENPTQQVEWLQKFPLNCYKSGSVSWPRLISVDCLRLAREGTRQSFIRGVSAPRSKPLPFYIPFLREKVSLSYTFCRKWYPFHIATERVLLNFSLEKTLKILE